jgi:hypothetical protein
VALVVEDGRVEKLRTSQGVTGTQWKRPEISSSILLPGGTKCKYKHVIM